MTQSRKSLLICLLLLALLAVTGVMSLFVGAVWVSPSDMLESPIFQLRLSRIVLGIIAGVGLSVSGVIFQALLRNPLAEPYILGVSSGAGLGAAVSIVLGLGALGMWMLPGVAFAGALITILGVYYLARQAGGAVPVQTLLLSGVVISTVLGSMLMFLVSTMPAENLHSVMWWLLGNLQVSDWSLVHAAGIIVSVGLAITILLARDLNLMTLGEESASHLGLHVERTKKLFFVVASLMTGATVAACGLIGFVGLIIPHTVRIIMGPDHRKLVPATAIAGAIFLILADSFARVIITPLEIPIGVVTAFLGGPFFLILLRNRKSAYWN